MEILRDYYLNKIIARKHNSLIKVITGIRRSGKSFLLFNLFKNHLLSTGVDVDHIIEIALDDRRNKEKRDPDYCIEFVTKQMKDSNMYYLLIDEIQFMDEFEDALNTFLHFKNLDVYVTGSNSKFLATDIITEFRGRGDEIHVNPLSFSEFYNFHQNMNWEDAYNEYRLFGGLPFVSLLNNNEDKENYLKKLFEETYIKDIVERNKIKDDTQLEVLINIIASSIGALTNPKKLANTFKSVEHIDISEPTIKNWLKYIEEAYLIKKSIRYDIKGKKYISTPSKYYFTDLGLRNAKLNFRQIEETHIMENIVYNELICRGYSVDVGVGEILERNENNNYVRKQIEVDFVVNRGSKRYYIQSAYSLPNIEKRKQEERPLTNIDDSFKKIIIVKDNVSITRDDNGIVTMGIKDFLLNDNSLDL